MSEQIIFEDFLKVDVWVGWIVEVEEFFEVCKFVYKMWIDFGFEIGVKWIFVQVIWYYMFEMFNGCLVMGVVNFLFCQIGLVWFEVLMFGVFDEDGEVVFIVLDKDVFIGGCIYQCCFVRWGF